MKDIPTNRLFLDVAETADLLAMDPRSVRRAIEAGELPGVRMGRVIRVPTAKLREIAGLPEEAASA